MEGSSLEVAVMTAVPFATPVTTPFSSTVATEALLVVQVTESSLTFQGLTVADSWTVLFTRVVADSGRVTEVTLLEGANRSLSVS